jgi:hypothetical protein
MADISKLEQQANLLMNNVSGWEQNVLTRIGKRIKKYGKLSLADVKSINNIATVKQDMEAITKELAKVTGYNISQIEQMYAELLEEQHLANQPLYDYRGKKFVPFKDNRELQAIARAYAKTTGETMINLAKTNALCILDHNGNVKGLQRTYTDVLDKAVMQVTTGATDFHTAMRDSIIELGGSGVRVDYGGGITRRLDTVVRQNLLWGAKQASIEYNDMIGEELGCDGIEVDWHSFPRPSHEFMQGKQFVIGKARTINGTHFESADEALERLQDYGCWHYRTLIICGVSEPRYSPEELKRLNEKNAKKYTIDGKEYSGYEVTQMQRRLESSVRNEKTTRELARASGDNALVKRCNERIKAYQGKYNEISEITGIQGDKKRMSVPRGMASVNGATPTPQKVDVLKKKEIVEIKDAKDFGYGDYTEKDYNKWWDEYEAHNASVKLTTAEKEAIENYTEGAYIGYNGVSRGQEAALIKKGYTPKDIERARKGAETLETALSKYDLPDDIVTHRFDRDVSWLTGSGNDVDSLRSLIGTTYKDEGFTSSGVLPNRARFSGGKQDVVHIEIITPKHTDGAFLSMSKKGENEFLYNRGTEFYVLDGGERVVKEMKFNFETMKVEEVEVLERFLKVQVVKK